MNVLLAEDHTIVREGLRKLLEADLSIEIVGEARDGIEAIKLTSTLKPNVVVMDISMPKLNGIEATRRIKKQYPDIKILILSMYDNEEYIKEVLKAGATGYLLKETMAKDLISAIKAVNRGESYFSPQVSRQLINVKAQNIKTRIDTLTLREREILKLIGEGRSNKEIADILFRSVKTIETHRSNIMRKLSLHRLADLIKYTIEKRL